jgi:membrane protease subunit (stomatin/prohibitin family)
MGFFSRGKSGGMMNVIRCDEQDYMVWKWRPLGQDVNSTSRENSIRWGSSLRVKDGEVAVFVYKQQDGTMQDFIEGPFDETIKTANFPVLSSILGMAYGGDSPFQAEVYFINLQGNNQLKFGVPYFPVFDPRLPDHGVPVAVRGTITFSLVNYKEFIKLNRLINFDHEQFLKQVKDAIAKYVKGVVTNIPQDMGIPAVHLERKILEVNELIERYLKPRMEADFGVTMKALDISALEIDKEDATYRELYRLTAGNTAKTLDAQTEVNIKNMQDTQAINAANMEETLRVQREEMQRAQRLQTETNFMGAHALDQQTEVLKTGAQSLGQMGSMGGGGGGSNPAGMMTGMMMGGAMGQQMAGMVNSMGQQMQNAMNTPPPIPNVQYHVSVNGMQMGPFNMQQLQQMAQSGQLTPQTYVWKQGMANWDFVCNIPELASLFAAPGTPPPPPPPPTM